MSLRSCTAIKASLSLALLFIASAASAESIGTVTHLDGILVASRADGSVKVLGVDAAIEAGDILSSRKQTYVAISLADNTTVTLGPDTDLKIERYVFHKDHSDGDGAVLALANGSVRVAAGVLGTRGSEEKFTLATTTSSLDISGASVVVEYVASAPEALGWRETSPRHAESSNWVPVSYSPTQRLAQLTIPTPGASRAPGLYVQVLDGQIHLTNPSGTANFAAGQFGYVATFKQPPVVLPSNPGIKFLPPPAFNSAPSGPTAPGPSNSVSCVVR